MFRQAAWVPLTGKETTERFGWSVLNFALFRTSKFVTCRHPRVFPSFTSAFARASRIPHHQIQSTAVNVLLCLLARVCFIYRSENCKGPLAPLTVVGSPEARDDTSQGPPNPSSMLNTLLPMAFAIAICPCASARVEAAAKRGNSRGGKSEGSLVVSHSKHMPIF